MKRASVYVVAGLAGLLSFAGGFFVGQNVSRVDGRESYADGRDIEPEAHTLLRDSSSSFPEGRFYSLYGFLEDKLEELSLSQTNSIRKVTESNLKSIARVTLIHKDFHSRAVNVAHEFGEAKHWKGYLPGTAVILQSSYYNCEFGDINLIVEGGPQATLLGLSERVKIFSNGKEVLRTNKFYGESLPMEAYQPSTTYRSYGPDEKKPVSIIIYEPGDWEQKLEDVFASIENK